MLTVDIINIEGQKIGVADLPEQIFGIEPNNQVISEYVRMYLNNQRIGSANTKNRREVSGGGKKPYRQKGTGQARQGSIRAPHYVGGGRAFGPTPKKWYYQIPQKKRRLALNSSLSSRVTQGKCLLLSSKVLPNNKTKDVASFLEKIDSKSHLVVLSEHDEIFLRCARNIAKATVRQWAHLNAFDVLKHETIIIEKSVVDRLIGEVNA